MPLIDQITALIANVENAYTEEYAQQQLLIRNFLQRQENDIIRVYVADAIGMGHQSTTVMIMYRLIELGFNHNFQIIYDDANTAGNTAEKLSKLIPGFIPNDGAPVIVPITEIINATMISLSNFRQNIANYPQSNFGFTGGFDVKTINLADAPIAGNAATKGVNVALFLKLQPFQWNQPNAIQRQGQLVVNQTSLDNVPALGNTTFKAKRGYYMEIPLPPPNDDIFGDDNKRDAYNAIITACKTLENPLNLLPVYGINDDPETGLCKTNPNIIPQNTLFDIIAAVRYTQRYSVLPNLARGAIMVVIATVSENCYNSPPDKAKPSLNTLLQGIGSENRKNTIDHLNQFVTDLQIVAGDISDGQHVEVIDFSDLEILNAKIAALQGDGGANKILVVKMPGLPVSAFDYMYASSSLPCLLEGKATANLVLNLNKPYLNMALGNNYPTLPFNPANGPEATRCYNAVSGFSNNAGAINNSLGENPLELNPPSLGLQATPMYKIAQLTIESNTAPPIDNGAYVSGGSLQPYFTQLQNFFQIQQKDKLFLALLYFLSNTGNDQI